MATLQCVYACICYLKSYGLVVSKKLRPATWRCANNADDIKLHIANMIIKVIFYAILSLVSIFPTLKNKVVGFMFQTVSEYSLAFIMIKYKISQGIISRIRQLVNTESIKVFPSREKQAAVFKSLVCFGRQYLGAYESNDKKCAGLESIKSYCN